MHIGKTIVQIIHLKLFQRTKFANMLHRRRGKNYPLDKHQSFSMFTKTVPTSTYDIGYHTFITAIVFLYYPNNLNLVIQF